MQEYEDIVNDVLDFCKSRKYTVAGIDKLFEHEDFNIHNDEVIARIMLYNHAPLMLEVYNTNTLGLFFNLFECDPFSASLFTKEFLEKKVDIISAFVEMKNSEGKITKLLFGEKAVEQYAKERKTKSETPLLFLN